MICAKIVFFLYCNLIFRGVIWSKLIDSNPSHANISGRIYVIDTVSYFMFV